MADYSIIYNRLIKNKKKIKNYLKKYDICAYRIFDKDIPEFPYIVDIYGSSAIIFEKGKRIQPDEVDLLQKRKETIKAIKEYLNSIFSIDFENIYLKSREKQKGKDQYEKISDRSHFFEINEGPLKFEINLNDYLDTGLFLDHRPLRQRLIEEAKDKKVLNLFSYTGSLSVAAAFSGAVTTTVDMSNTYLEWARRNFELNELDLSQHDFIRADVTKYINEIDTKYDLILLDPPSFSNSKKMDDLFDVQRDHKDMINTLMSCLKPNGKLIFSNNYRRFKLNSEIENDYEVEEITYKSIPEDFRDRKIHSCFELKNIN